MKKIMVEVNPQLELMNSILYISKHNEILRTSFGFNSIINNETEYTKIIREYFESFQSNRIIHLIEDMTVKGFYLSRPIELMCSVGEFPMLARKFKMSKLCEELCGGEDKVNILLEELRNFCEESNYLEFFKQVGNYYEPFVESVNEFVNKYSFVSVMEEFYGKSQNAYHYIITNLLRGSFGISFLCKEKLEMFNVMNLTSSYDTNKQNEFNTGALSINVLFHEFAHPIVNPLTDKFNEIVKNKSQVYDMLKLYKKPGFQSGYGDWIECINEHIVRAVAIYLSMKIGEKEYAIRHQEYDLYLGYRYVPALIDRFQYYEKNRDSYKTIDDFYPELLEVF